MNTKKTILGSKTVISFILKDGSSESFEKADFAFGTHYPSTLFRRKERYDDAYLCPQPPPDLNSYGDLTQINTVSGKIILWKDVDKDSIKVKKEECQIPISYHEFCDY